MIYESVTSLIDTYNPEVMAVESLFFCKNVKTAMSVGQSRGIVLLAGANADLRIVEYTPLEVKLAVVGYGKAEKRQVQFMVKRLLNLDETPKVDAADALAIAICHINSIRCLKIR
jgi:crossover junction endodeoxyribonuclease RuvC